ARDDPLRGDEREPGRAERWRQRRAQERPPERAGGDHHPRGDQVADRDQRHRARVRQHEDRDGVQQLRGDQRHAVAEAVGDGAPPALEQHHPEPEHRERHAGGDGRCVQLPQLERDRDLGQACRQGRRDERGDERAAAAAQEARHPETKYALMPMTAYAPTSCRPSSQLLRPSSEITTTITVATPTMATSNGVKTKSIGFASTRLMKTSSGAMSIATCVDEPTAISSVTSSRRFTAKSTAEACSAALPMIGMRIRPTKTAGTCSAAIAGCSAPTRISDSTATRA